MKALLLILFPFMLTGQIKTNMPLDYNMHVQGSMALQGAATSLFYWKTEKNVLSNFLGALVAASIGAGKEYIHDRYLKRGTFSVLDLEADYRGVTYAFCINLVNIHRMEKKAVDLEIFNNLNRSN